MADSSQQNQQPPSPLPHSAPLGSDRCGACDGDTTLRLTSSPHHSQFSAGTSSSSFVPSGLARRSLMMSKSLQPLCMSSAAQAAASAPTSSTFTPMPPTATPTVSPCHSAYLSYYEDYYRVQYAHAARVATSSVLSALRSQDGCTPDYGSSGASSSALSPLFLRRSHPSDYLLASPASGLSSAAPTPAPAHHHQDGVREASSRIFAVVPQASAERILLSDAATNIPDEHVSHQHQHQHQQEHQQEQLQPLQLQLQPQQQPQQRQPRQPQQRLRNYINNRGVLPMRAILPLAFRWSLVLFIFTQHVSKMTMRLFWFLGVIVFAIQIRLIPNPLQYLTQQPRNNRPQPQPAAAAAAAAAPADAVDANNHNNDNAVGEQRQPQAQDENVNEEANAAPPAAGVTNAAENDINTLLLPQEEAPLQPRRPNLIQRFIPEMILALVPGTHPLDPATSAAEHIQAAEEWQGNDPNNGALENNLNW